MRHTVEQRLKELYKQDTEPCKQQTFLSFPHPTDLAVTRTWLNSLFGAGDCETLLPRIGLLKVSCGLEDFSGKIQM